MFPQNSPCNRICVRVKNTFGKIFICDGIYRILFPKWFTILHIADLATCKFSSSFHLQIYFYFFFLYSFVIITNVTVANLLHIFSRILFLYFSWLVYNRENYQTTKHIFTRRRDHVSLSLTLYLCSYLFESFPNVCL